MHPDNIERFARRFAGYTKAHGVFELTGTKPDGKREGKAQTIQEPPTLTKFKAHLEGTTGIGILPLDDNGCVSWACIDIDVIGIDLAALAKKVEDLKLPLIVCRSKSGGAHCFLFLSQPTDARPVREYMVACSSALGHPEVEIFPKQTERQEGETGNWLNMPYYNVENTLRFAMTSDGQQLELEEFLNAADAVAIDTLPDAQEVEVAPSAALPVRGSKRHVKFVLPDVIPESGGPYNGRNETLFKYGCSLQSKGWSDEDIESELRQANADRCDPPLARQNLNNVIAQVMKYPKGEPIPDWVAELNERHAVVAESGKALILNTGDWDPAMKRRVLTYSSFSDFKNLYCNAYVEIGRKYAPKGTAWISHPQRRQYNGTTFAPNEDVPGWFNMWQGYSVDPTPGDWSLLRAHIFENLCASQRHLFDYLIGWMAFAIKHPERVPEVAIVLLGGRGVGKGVVVNAHGSLMREHYVSVSNPEHVSGKFNAHLKDCVILFLDEAFWAGDKRGEGTLKRLITDEFIPVEKKRIDVVMSRNYCHVWVASNEQWAVPSGIDERRFFALDVSDKRKQDHAYFGAIAKQLDEGGRAAMLYDLLNHDLTNFNPRQAPMTPALFRQKVHSMDKKTAWWFETLWNGEVPMPRGSDDEDAGGWQTEVVKDILYQSYLEHSGNAGARAHRGTQTELGMFLRSVLPDGWPKEKRLTFLKQRGTFQDGAPVMMETTAPGFVFPELSLCRTAFDQKAKSTHGWPEEEDYRPRPAQGAARREHARDEDEELPF